MTKSRPIFLLIMFIVFFAAPGFAADAKIYGEYYLQGWYEKNHSLLARDGGAPPDSTLENRGSSAFYTQRLRMGVDLKVARGLMLGTRFDALDRKWMAARRPVPTSTTLRSSTDSEQENIGFEVAYAVFDTPIGRWTAGTHAGGSSYSTGLGGVTNSIAWTYLHGPWLLSAAAKKGSEPSEIGTGTNNDSNTYSLVGQYKWDKGLFYLRFSDVHSRTNNGLPVGSYKSNYYVFSPIIRQKIGIFSFDWDANFVSLGWSRKYNDAPPPGNTDIKITQGINSRLKLHFDMAPAGVGAYFVYNQGDDPATLDKKEGTFREVLDYDRSFNPCLLLWNEDYMHWLGGDTEGTVNTGTISGNAGSKGIKTYLDNVWMYQIYGNYNVTPKMYVHLSYTFAYADKKPTMNMAQPVSASNPVFVSDKIGSELDFIVKYKIYENLEYMVGAAYLWTGDYFKGTNPHAKLSNNYLLTHKLTLTF
ncbi:MAG: hypothetical protein JW943_03235 [Deltaproteobacteria bacterium]|nr:hypothetical protein [Deltaproteobacteria bacterium]